MPNESPPRRRVVVDGSNIATEGRTLPSLAQLDDAIRTFLEEFGGFSSADVTVVVDASFGHRINESERAEFEEAVLHGEMVTPPAGAVGRGDGFILRIAEKSGALVLSNDSFQEFHAERPWLFEPGRLIGGKPVPGVGWVFTPRTPVRGPRSRSVTAQSKREAMAANGAVEAIDSDQLDESAAEAPAPKRRRRSTKAAAPTESVATSSDTRDSDDAYEDVGGRSTRASKATKATKATKKAAKAAPATKAAKATKAVKATKAAKAAAVEVSPVPAAAGRGRDVPVGEALNDAMTFLTFVAEHPVGSTFDGVVVSFTSHGAHGDVGGMLCHIPLRNLGDPAPQKARTVLAKGETREFALVSLDAPRRRAELSLPGLAG